MPFSRHRITATSAAAVLLATWLSQAGAQLPLPQAKPIPPRPASSALDKREIRAQLSPRRFTTLAAEIGAKISRLPVAEGSAFRQGQTLINFDCTLQSVQLNKSRAALGAADKNFRANKRLAELNSVGKVEMEMSEAEAMKARADVAASQAILSKCAIAAPFSGRVAEQKVREQQYVQPGQPILDIIDDSTLELEFIVPSKWMAWLKPGMAFQVKIDETAHSYPAKIQRIGARVDPVSQSIKLNAVIDGKFPELVAGMSGSVLMTPPASK